MEGEGGREMVVFEGKQREMGMEEKKGKEYPAPLFDHEELCGDPGIFIEALRRFHSVMGTKFMIPVIGGKDLSLHRLYVEVTKRGGLEKVIVEKRWREVISIFNFPPTTTSASFVLRKYYLSLLHHFEQVYFFGVRGRLVPPTAALQTRNQLCKVDDIVRSDSRQVMRKKKAFQQAILSVAQSDPPRDGVQNQPSPSPTPPVHESMPSATGGTRNFTVSGTIDGKFDYGYFVTVKIGSQVLHGVLYHIHQHQLGTPSIPSPHVNPIYQTPSSSFAPSTMETSSVPYIPSTRSVGRRRRLKNRDPARPKPNRSSYNFFFAEKHYELKAQYPNMEREYSKRIGECWSKLTDEERQVYEDYARRDKERYKKELQCYKEKFKFSEPKPFEETTRDIEIARKEVARREMHDYNERRIEIARSKNIAAYPTSVEEIAETIEEQQPHELGQGLLDSAMETDILNLESTGVNTAE